MGLPVQKQVQIWSIVAVTFVLIVWVLGNVLLPFVLGAIIAYCLDPVADFFERLGCGRLLATVLVALIAVMMFATAIVLLVPTLIEQTQNLIRVAPEIFRDLQTFVNTRFPDIMVEGSRLRESLLSIGEAIQNRGGEFVNSVLASTLSVINIVTLCVIVPVVAFYLLLDWDNMTARVDELIPRDHVDTVRKIATDIDDTLASFIRGQGTVCLILGTYYAVALGLVGLNFGIVVGFIAGLLTFIPYVGALFGGALAIGLALFQFWGDWTWIAAVGIIFMLGQVVEGNILTPNLVGSSVGLHPVWLLLALSVFGTMFGFLGLLLAVPVAAMIGVLIRFFITGYRDGRLYKGFKDLNG